MWVHVLLILTAINPVLQKYAPPDCRPKCEDVEWFCAREGFDPDNVRCIGRYEGFFGLPFVCTPPCRDGVHFEPIACYSDPGYYRLDPCDGETDCPYEVVGRYQTCGGPIWPFMVDDEDNIYFSTGSGRLHSVDRRGNFRWWFELCKYKDTEYDCHSLNLHHLMDYYGNIYVFGKDELFVLDRDGHVLLQRSIILPGLRANPSEGGDWPGLDIAGGNYTSNIVSCVLFGGPVLTKEGIIYAPFIIRSSPSIRRYFMGIAKLDRTGRVLDVIVPSKGEWIRFVDAAGFVMDHDERMVLNIVKNNDPEFLPCDDDFNRKDKSRNKYERSYTVTIENDKVKSEVEWPREDPPPWWPESRDWWDLEKAERIDYDGYAAVGPDNRVYAISSWERLISYAAGDPAKVVMALWDIGEFSAFNRPVISPDGTVFVTHDESPVTFWAIDSKSGETQDPVKWYWTGGGGLIAGTPVVTRSGNVYVNTGSDLVAFSPEGEVLWHHDAPGGTYPSAMAVLSDGTLVVGALDGYVYFLKEKNIDNGGLAEGGWPRAFHDNYHSSNAAHPFRWDRSKPPPYPPIEKLMKELPPDWNCNYDDRCFPREYYDTCDWGGTSDWAGKSVQRGTPGAICPPPAGCDPKQTPCLVEGFYTPGQVNGGGLCKGHSDPRVGRDPALSSSETVLSELKEPVEIFGDADAGDSPDADVDGRADEEEVFEEKAAMGSSSSGCGCSAGGNGSCSALLGLVLVLCVACRRRSR